MPRNFSRVNKWRACDGSACRGGKAPARVDIGSQAPSQSAPDLWHLLNLGIWVGATMGAETRHRGSPPSVEVWICRRFTKPRMGPASYCLPCTGTTPVPLSRRWVCDKRHDSCNPNRIRNSLSSFSRDDTGALVDAHRKHQRCCNKHFNHNSVSWDNTSALVYSVGFVAHHNCCTSQPMTAAIHAVKNKKIAQASNLNRSGLLNCYVLRTFPPQLSLHCVWVSVISCGEGGFAAILFLPAPHRESTRN